jgi:hypothetical protein
MTASRTGKRMSFTDGEKLGGYEILGPLGAGGMGELPYWTDEAALRLPRGLVTQIHLLLSGEKDGMRGLPSPIP